MKHFILLLAAAPIPAGAQTMPGMTMPADHPRKPVSKPAKATTHPPAHARHRVVVTAIPEASPSAPPMAADAMPGMGDAAMAGMTMEAKPPASIPPSTTLPPGSAPVPSPPHDHYADRDYPGAAMALARHRMMIEQGGQTFHQILFNLAEFQIGDGRGGYRWDGEAWIGGDRDRLTLKSEGEGDRRQTDAAEIQALYSRAIGPYFDLQTGIRHDLAPASRSYATVGVEGLAPYMFETEAALFVSDRGDLLARVEGWYDARLTQRVVLQPRIELNLAAQDVARSRIGAGLSNAEVGLRLRYEVAPEFAPYLGLSWDRKTGATARYAHEAGDSPSRRSLVVGVRFWL